MQVSVCEPTLTTSYTQVSLQAPQATPADEQSRAAREPRSRYRCVSKINVATV